MAQRLAPGVRVFITSRAFCSSRGQDTGTIVRRVTADEVGNTEFTSKFEWWVDVPGTPLGRYPFLRSELKPITVLAAAKRVVERKAARVCPGHAIDNLYHKPIEA